METPVKWHY